MLSCQFVVHAFFSSCAASHLMLMLPGLLSVIIQHKICLGRRRLRRRQGYKIVRDKQTRERAKCALSHQHFWATGTFYSTQDKTVCSIHSNVCLKNPIWIRMSDQAYKMKRLVAPCLLWNMHLTRLIFSLEHGICKKAAQSNSILIPVRSMT